MAAATTYKEPLPYESQISVAQTFRNRVRVVKDKLPPNYREIIYRHYPGYKAPRAQKRINNVLCFRTADAHLTDVLERIVKRELR